MGVAIALLAALAAADGANTTVYYMQGQPKSGTTLLEVVISKLAAAAGARYVEHAHHVPEHWELPGRAVFAGWQKHHLPGASAAFFASGLTVETSYKRALKRCVDERKTIWSEACVPAATYVGAPAGARYILILRDPRAVVVSLGHYFGEALTSVYYLKNVPRVAAITSLRFYWHTDVLPRHGRPSLLLYYEDMVADPRREYHKLAAWMNITLPDTSISAIVRSTTPAAMREAERHHALPGVNRGGDRAKVRAAKPQGFRGEMGAATVAESTRKMRRLLHPVLAAKWIIPGD